MDHSPSEQVVAEDVWHTTVLVVSQGEHFDLAKRLAADLQTQNGLLRKWKRSARGGYAQRFEDALLHRAPEFPVAIRAFSARGTTVSKFARQAVVDWALSDVVRVETKGNRTTWTFGPFTQVRRDDTQRRGVPIAQVTFPLVEAQAQYLMFVLYALHSTHREMLLRIQTRKPSIDWLDWQLMPNMFPGGVGGAMAKTFEALLSSNRQRLRGSIRTMTILKSSDDQGAAIADNVAGMLSSKLKAGAEPSCPAFHDFCWRRFS